MAIYTIDASAHARLKAFLQGKGIKAKGKVDVDLSDGEASTLLRKAASWGGKGVSLKPVKAPEPKEPAKAHAPEKPEAKDPEKRRSP